MTSISSLPRDLASDGLLRSVRHAANRVLHRSSAQIPPDPLTKTRQRQTDRHPTRISNAVATPLLVRAQLSFLTGIAYSASTSARSPRTPFARALSPGPATEHLPRRDDGHDGPPQRAESDGLTTRTANCRPRALRSRSISKRRPCTQGRRHRKGATPAIYAS
jgi:hypothetical protein